MTKVRGKKVTKMPRPVIRVSADQIETAAKRDSSHCMIADAIKAQLPNARSVSVDLASIRWSDPTTRLRYTYLTPRRAQLALLDFDQGNPVQPFSFELRNPIVTSSHAGKEQPDQVKPPTKATLVAQQLDQSRSLPSRKGGTPPPIGPLTNTPTVRVGKRRAYGLQQLTR